MERGGDIYQILQLLILAFTVIFFVVIVFLILLFIWIVTALINIVIVLMIAVASSAAETASTNVPDGNMLASCVITEAKMDKLPSQFQEWYLETCYDAVHKTEIISFKSYFLLIELNFSVSGEVQ